MFAVVFDALFTRLRLFLPADRYYALSLQHIGIAYQPFSNPENGNWFQMAPLR